MRNMSVAKGFQSRRNRVLLSVLAVLFLSSLFFSVGTAVAQDAQSDAVTSQEKDVQEYTLSPEKYEKAIGYARARYTLYFIGVVYGIILLFLVLRFRLAPKYRDLAEKVHSRRFLRILVFSLLLIFTLSILEFPLTAYGHSLRLKYDQSIQGWGSWVWDWLKGALIELVVAWVLIWILYGVIRRSPKGWWFYFWLASLPIIVFLLFITPLVIEPLFFDFKPLDQSQPGLVTEIEKVVERGGLSIPRERIFEMIASEKLKSVNAYVTGFGASKRVVVWDTTLKRMTQDQTLFVFGHEMGHYVLNHIPRTIAFIALVLLVFLFLGYRGMRWMLGKWGSSWGIRDVEDFASLPVLMLLFSVFSFFASPVFSNYSRYQEHEADVYGLEVVHGIIADSPRAAAGAFQVLGEINLSDPEPHPFIKFWLYSHPPLSERLVFARTYDPWSKGEKPQFVP